MKNEKKPRFISSKRVDVEVILPDGRIISGKRGSALSEFLSVLDDWEEAPIVGAVVEGHLRELSYLIQRDCTISPVTMASSDGSKIYRRSLIFLLETSFHELFPDDFLNINHSVPNGGYYCKVIGGNPLSQKEVNNLEEHMRKLVGQDLKIKKDKVPLDEALAYFAEKSYKDKIHLLKYRKKPYLVLYQLNNHRDYHHGYMVPSTGYLKTFKLINSGDGFILQYPRRKTPEQLFPMPPYGKLIDLFKQYGSWLESLDIDSVAALNDSISNKAIREVILVSEALHEQNQFIVKTSDAPHSITDPWDISFCA